MGQRIRAAHFVAKLQDRLTPSDRTDQAVESRQEKALKGCIFGGIYVPLYSLDALHGSVRPGRLYPPRV